MQFKHKLSYIVLGGLFVVVGLLGITSISWAQRGTWTFKTPMPTARCFLGSCVLDGKIYAIGGATSPSAVTSALEVYDPLTDTWTQKKNMPVALCFVNVAVLDEKIYVFGGKISAFGAVCKHVFIYTPDTDEWTQIDDSPHEYGSPVTAVVDGQAYLIGGAIEETQTIVPYVHVYNPSTGSWTKKTDMPTPRIMHAACVFDKLIYCIGGTTENWATVFYRNVEVYDPLEDTWTIKNAMPVGRWGLAACTLDSLIYVIGGYYGQNSCDRVDILNLVSDEWTTGTPMQQIRRAHTACVFDGKIYVLGGSYTNGGTPTFLSSVEVYDPDHSTGILKDKTNGSFPENFYLEQNYPNPFNPVTMINYQLPMSNDVELSVYNLLGQKVATLVSEKQKAGYHQVKWDASRTTGMASGIYLYRLRAGQYIDTRKMVLIK